MTETFSDVHPSELGEVVLPVQEPAQRRHTKSPEQKIAALQVKMAKVQEQIRRQDTHRKVILGGACVAVLRNEPTDIATFRRLLWAALSEKDRETIKDIFPEHSRQT